MGVTLGRRQFLEQATWGLGALAATRALLATGSASASPAAAFTPDVEVSLRAAPARAPFFPGELTEVWSLQGRVLRGNRDALEDSGTPALGPTFRVRPGQRLRVTLENGIPQPTILHWHGLRVPEAADGHPRLAIAPGQRYTYEFEIRNRPGTYWYHAHPDRRTGEQVYRGLAGLFVVEDESEISLGLPGGPSDRALVIQDRSFDSSGQLVYLASPMERMRGFLGDRILVNGEPDFTLRVAASAYRLRLLNASNSRIYRLAWDDAAPLIVIGTDGGLLEVPTPMPYVMLAPGERVELWADFAPDARGAERKLVSLPLDGMTAVAPLGVGRVALGRTTVVFTAKVDRPGLGRGRLPAHLSNIERYRWADAVNAGAPRHVRATMLPMAFGLNGRAFEMDAVAADERGKLGTIEAWEFDNSAPGGMGMMGPLPHPFHIHGGQFQVIRREGVAHAGYVDAGWKDTVLVMPGERATVLMKYLDYAGLYLYHCHNLEHEDGGMMRNFAIDR